MMGEFLAIGEALKVLGRNEMSRAEPGKEVSLARVPPDAILKFMADWNGMVVATELFRWPRKGFDKVFIGGSFMGYFSLLKFTKVAPPNCFLEAADMLIFL